MTTDQYDFITIGGGCADFAAATKASDLVAQAFVRDISVMSCCIE